MEGAVDDLCDWINLMELEEEEVRVDLNCWRIWVWKALVASYSSNIQVGLATDKHSSLLLRKYGIQPMQ